VDGGKAVGGGAAGWDGAVADAEDALADGEAADADFPWLERRLRRWFRAQARARPRRPAQRGPRARSRGACCMASQGRG